MYTVRHSYTLCFIRKDEYENQTVVELSFEDEQAFKDAIHNATMWLLQEFREHNGIWAEAKVDLIKQIRLDNGLGLLESKLFAEEFFPYLSAWFLYFDPRTGDKVTFGDLLQEQIDKNKDYTSRY